MTIGNIGLSIIVLFLLVRTIRQPSVAVAGCLCLFGIEQWGQSSVPFLAANGTVTNYAVGLLLAFAIALALFRGGTRIIHFSIVSYMVFALIFYAYLSSIWTPREDLFASEWSKWWPYLLCFVGFAPLLIDNVPSARAMLSAFAILGSALAIMLLFFVKWESRWIVIESGRYAAHANPLAVAQMAGNVFLVLTLCRRLNPIPLWSVVRWVFAAVCVALAVKSGSRGQVLSLLIVLMVFWPLIGRQFAIGRTFAVFVGCAALATAMSFAVDAFWGGNEQRWTEETMKEDLVGRIDMAYRLLTAWWSGGGLTIVGGLGNSASFDPRILGYYPHILPLEIIAEEGVVGFSLYLAVLALAFGSFAKALSLGFSNIEEKETIIAFAAMFSYAFILTFKQGSLINSVDHLMLVIITARLCELSLGQPRVGSGSPRGALSISTAEHGRKAMYPLGKDLSP